MKVRLSKLSNKECELYRFVHGYSTYKNKAWWKIKELPYIIGLERGSNIWKVYKITHRRNPDRNSSEFAHATQSKEECCEWIKGKHDAD